jgi:hypothetical protein
MLDPHFVRNPAGGSQIKLHPNSPRSSGPPGRATWQIAAEAIVPLNRGGGNGMGFRAQLLFFIDDLLPSLFGKPLLTDKPDRSLIAWH